MTLRERADMYRQAPCGQLDDEGEKVAEELGVYEEGAGKWFGWTAQGEMVELEGGSAHPAVLKHLRAQGAAQEGGSQADDEVGTGAKVAGPS